MKHAFFVSLWGWIAIVTAADASDHVTDVTTACTNYISTAFGWPFCQKVNKRQSQKCFCPQQDWLASVMGCIDALNHGTNSTKANVKALQKYCKSANTSASEINRANTLLSTLPVLTTPISSYKARNVTGGFRLPEEQYEWAFSTWEKNNNRSDKATNYGIGLMCFWYGVVLLRSIANWARNMFPKLPLKLDSKPVRWLRRYYLVAPLAKFSHSTPATLGKSRIARFFTFNLPTRQSAFIVLAFSAVNLALMFGSLDIVKYNYAYDCWSAQYSKALSVRSGWLVIYILPAMFLFAGRNNFMIQMTGWPLDEFNVFHKWLGRTCIVDLLIHTAAYTYVRVHGGRYQIMWSTPYWQHGVAALVMGCVMTATGIHWFRRFSYEIFLVIHILCAIGFLVGGYYHLKIIHEDLRVFYAVWAIWAFDRAARLGRILIANPFSRATVTYHDGHTVELTITYSKLWKVPPGSYIFVHVVQPMFFWESHPFTIMQGVRDDHQGCIKLYCRGLDGMTKRLVEKCQRNNGSFETYVWLDGPYHQHIETKAFKEKLFIAGGIGITAPFSFVQGNIAKGFTDLTVHWGIRDNAPLEWFANEIQYMLQNGVKLHIHVGDFPPMSSSSSDASCISDKEKTLFTEGPNQITMKEGRMDIMKIISQAAASASGPLAILTCGPGPVNDLSRQAVVANLTSSPHYIEYFEESFSW